MKVKDLFYVTSGVRITEKDIYYHQGQSPNLDKKKNSDLFIPCVTAQTSNEGITWYGEKDWLTSIKKSGRSVIIETPCITWSKDGFYAGKMFYRDYPFYPNDHCGVLIPKNEDEVNLIWFLFYYQDLIFSKVTAKDAQGMLYEEQMENIDVNLPDISVQNEYAAIYLKREKIKNKMIKIEKQISNLFQKKILLTGEKFKLHEICFSTVGRTINYKDIYKCQGNKENGVPVYSASTQNKGLMGYIDSKYLDKFEKIGYPGQLTWTTNGFAGRVFLRNSIFLMTEKCGKIVIKPSFKEIINPKWLEIYLNGITGEYATSKSGNGKLEKSQLDQIPVILPEKQIQDEIANEYLKLENAKDLIEKITKELSFKKST